MTRRFYHTVVITSGMVVAGLAKNEIYVFGDNLLRYGKGGQAKPCRGHLNTVGVATKRRPEMTEGSFFSDQPDELEVVLKDLARVVNFYRRGFTIIWPTAGLGTGRAQLMERSPEIYRLIRSVETMLQQIDVRSSMNLKE